MIPSQPTQRLVNMLAKTPPAHVPTAALALAGVAAFLVYRYGERRYAAGYCDCARLRCSRR
jgi:hypothetical protein